MTTFLFTSVSVSGTAIIAKGVPFNRRNRFILTAGLALGYGATLVPDYFSKVFSGYTGEGDRALRGFLDAIGLVMETGFAVTAVVTGALNLGLPVELEDTEGEGGSVVAVEGGRGGDGASGSGSGSGMVGGEEEVKGGKEA
jgi:xanthine/uracil permease